ncbi:MAG: spore coat protein CotJB [Bacillota bacterium]
MHEVDPERCEMLLDISALDFAVLELTLYLDTHPDDRGALNERNNYLQEMQVLVDRYEAIYGPLFDRSEAEYPWTWIDEPWPWELRCGGDV